MNRSLWFGVLISVIALAVGSVFVGIESQLLVGKDDRLTAVMEQLEPATGTSAVASTTNQEQSDPKKTDDTPSSKKDYPQPVLAGF